MEDESLLINEAPRRRHIPRKRPTNLWGFHIPLFLTAIFMFAFGAAGAAALPTYLHGNPVDSTVIGYVVVKGYNCIWSGFPTLEYTVNNATYILENFYPYAVCGDYQDSALYNTQQLYPMGTNIRVWYLDGKPSKLAQSGDPTTIVYIMIICWSICGACLLAALIIHLVGIWCYGYETCCCKESNTFRC